MARARKQTKQTKETTPGFALKITPQTELGLAMLIAETEDGHYEPVAVVASVSEAQEIAKSDFARRLEEVAMGCEDVNGGIAWTPVDASKPGVQTESKSSRLHSWSPNGVQIAGL